MSGRNYIACKIDLSFPVFVTTDCSKAMFLVLLFLRVALCCLLRNVFQICPLCCLSVILWILAIIVTSLLGKRELFALLLFGVLMVYCLLYFYAYPLGVIDRLCSVIVALLGHLLYYIL